MGVNPTDPDRRARGADPSHQSSDQLNDGPSALAVHLPPLLATAGVRTVQLDVLTRDESFRGATVSPQAQEITGPAREEHRRRHFGFWEFVLARANSTDTETRHGLIHGALRHNSSETITLRMDHHEFSTALADGAFTGLRPRTIVSLTSHIPNSADPRAGAQEFHLPMLDLGLAVGPESLNTCVAAIAALGVRGLLLQSGRSYHFIGNQPLSLQELTRFLARAQLLSPIVDSRWASHQLLDGQCALRISTDLETALLPHQFSALV